MGSAFPVADELGAWLDCRRPARPMVRICGECHFKFPPSTLGSIGQATLYLRLETPSESLPSSQSVAGAAPAQVGGPQLGKFPRWASGRASGQDLELFLIHRRYDTI